jgi:hypothetical protein
MNYILATVEIQTCRALGDLAEVVETCIVGLAFEKEETGRFEEVPAYVAHDSGMEFVLFGRSEGDDRDPYVLQLSARTSLTIQEYRTCVLEFVGNVLVDKETDSRGYLDYSKELAKALAEKGLRTFKIA